MAKPWHRWPPVLRAPDGPLRLTIYARTGMRCALRLDGCTNTPTHLDHITPPSLGGAWFDPTNLQGACSTCNRRKGTGPTTYPKYPTEW